MNSAFGFKPLFIPILLEGTGQNDDQYRCLELILLLLFQYFWRGFEHSTYKSYSNYILHEIQKVSWNKKLTKIVKQV